MPQTENDTNERRGFQMRGIAATPAGSTNDCCLVMAAAPVAVGQYGFTTVGTVSTSDWCEVTNSPVDGTSVRFLKRGIYELELEFEVDGVSEFMAGISLNEAAGSLVANPTPSTVGAAMESYDRWSGLAAGDNNVMKCHATIYITQAMINAGTTRVRPRASDAADGTPVAANMTLGNSLFDCKRTGDLPGA